MTQSHPPGPPEQSGATLAVDIGGTTLKGAAFDAAGRLIGLRTAATFEVADDAYAGVSMLIERLRADARSAGHAPTGIGVASPGLVDPGTGTIVYAGNLGWNDLPLRRRLEDRFGIPVHVGNDARTGALAEQASHLSAAGSADAGTGAGTGTDAGTGAVSDPAFQDFVFIPIGTGVSAAVVTAGVLVQGATGAAGEFGHMLAIAGGDHCVCGQDGCIEAYASAASILARYARKGGTRATSTHVVAATLDSDPLAAEVWADAVEALAIGIAALSAVLDPAVIVIGGGVSAAGDTLLDPLRARLDARLGWRPSPRIERSALSSHGGLIGAAILGRAGRPISSGFAVAAHASLTTGLLPAGPSTDSGYPPDGGAAHV